MALEILIDKLTSVHTKKNTLKPLKNPLSFWSGIKKPQIFKLPMSDMPMKDIKQTKELCSEYFL